MRATDPRHACIYFEMNRGSSILLPICMIMDILFIKKVNSVAITMKGKSGPFGTVALSVLYFAVLVVFIGPIFGRGWVYILTFLTSIIVSLLQGMLIKKYSIGWLKNFVLSFSLIIGMCSAILWTNVVG